MLVRFAVYSVLWSLVLGLSSSFADDRSAHDPEEFLAPKDGAPMIVIPAGSFPMGVPDGDRDGVGMNIRVMKCL